MPASQPFIPASCRPAVGAIPGEVFITQFASANLTMPGLNLHIAQTATMLGLGQTATSHIAVHPLHGADAVDATIHVRMPGCAADWCLLRYEMDRVMPLQILQASCSTVWLACQSDGGSSHAQGLEPGPKSAGCLSCMKLHTEQISGGAPAQVPQAMQSPLAIPKLLVT